MAQIMSRSVVRGWRGSLHAEPRSTGAVLDRVSTLEIGENRVAAYWSSRTPRPAGIMVREAVICAGLDPIRLSRDDMRSLSDLDEFHCLGPQASTDLAALAGVCRGCRVLDVGCGLGGPARYLAATHGSSVVGIDITKDYLAAARELTEAMGLSRLVSYRHGDAVDLPFGKKEFDIVWLQVATTNIAERSRLYAEMRRVLKLGGRVAMFDIVAGPGGPVHFPVPWGYDESTSALLSLDETRAALRVAGLTLTAIVDVSELAEVWFAQQVGLSCKPEGPPPIGFHVLLPEWGVMARNQWRNIRERRITFCYLIAE